MVQILKPDLCVIGAGSGGVSIASAAAQLGVSVVLVEKNEMGAGTLNSGSIPSKALIAASRRAHMMRMSGVFGIHAKEPKVDWLGVHDHIQSVVATIAPNCSAERLTGLGVYVIRATAQFQNKKTVIAGEYEIRARRFVIATGSSPIIPAIPGIDQVRIMTNETIFQTAERMDHLIVLGAGTIGLELAQAYRRLGAGVTVLEAATALPKDDPELTRVVLKQIREEGIDIYEAVQVERMEPLPDQQGIRVHVVRQSETGGHDAGQIEGTHLLIAAGRRPNIEGLNLEAGKIKYQRTGIKVSKGLKTTNRRVFAIGDVTGGLQFTHAAHHQAQIVLKRALFRLPVKINVNLLPWVTYTDPELAHIGLNEDQARKIHGKIRILRWPYSENHRAQAERATKGFIKVIIKTNGEILGVTLVGEQAGELIQSWSLAMTQSLKISDMVRHTIPYPTYSEISKHVAYSWVAPKLATPVIRKIIRFLAKFG